MPDDLLIFLATCLLLCVVLGGAVIAQADKVRAGIDTLLGRKQRSALEPAAVCACTHGFGAHDQDGCHEQNRVLVERRNPRTVRGSNKHGHAINVVVYDHERWESQPCACKRYTGPEPLPSYFDAGIAALD